MPQQACRSWPAEPGSFMWIPPGAVSILSVFFPQAGHFGFGASAFG
jgi:hypothetical protein